MPRHEWERQIYRASRLDEFRLYLSGEHFDGSEYTATDFVTRMTEPEESDAMIAGTALHAVMERSAFGDLPNEIKQDGWAIIFDIDAEIMLPAMREVPVCREHKGIKLHGRVDAMGAHTVHDIKTTQSIDADRYLDSAQWKAYLYMTDYRRFVYDIFRVSRDEKRREMVVREYVPITLIAYPGLSRDVESLLVEFDAAVKALGIPEIMRKKWLNDPVNLLAAG